MGEFQCLPEELAATSPLPRRLLSKKKQNKRSTHSQCEILDNHVSKVMIMPFFKNKFSPKRTPTRKASVSLANKDLSPKRIERELGPEVGPIKLRLGEQEATFDSGVWIPQTGKIGGTFRENEKLRKELKKLEEENNLLKIKFELLLDMLTETTAEVHLHRGELESLRSKLSYVKRTAT